MFNDQWAMFNDQWAMFNDQWAMFNDQWISVFFVHDREKVIPPIHAVR